jgi:hypothetical protein
MVIVIPDSVRNEHLTRASPMVPVGAQERVHPQDSRGRVGSQFVESIHSRTLFAQRTMCTTLAGTLRRPSWSPPPKESR